MPVPVITVAQMREWEKVTWSSGVTEDAVMRNAGAAVARCAERMTAEGDLILFLAGKGHNGDDAAYGCEFIQGRRAELMRVLDPEASGRELQARLDRRPALIVDGLFGIGLNRPLSGAWMNLIDQINRAGVPILAVDVPSGLNSDSGLPLDVAIRADRTLTFGAVKHGLLKSGAVGFVGQLEVASDIGLSPYPFTTEVNLTVARDFHGFPPKRPITGHKGTFGHLAIVAGSPGYHGAAVLAARGAQRAQPGLITVCAHQEVRIPIASQLQAVMVYAGAEDFELPASCSAVVVGPGLASAELTDRFKRSIRRLWQDSLLPVIADASALDWLPDGPCVPGVLRVMTPHPGEAARLLQSSVAEVQRDRVASVRELSRRWGNCCVVLKGHQTLVGRDREEIYVNNSGNPHLAQGGSGDLLAGYLGGLLAQPELQRDALFTVRFAVWQHGAAAESLLARKPNFIIEELADELGLVRP